MNTETRRGIANVQRAVRILASAGSVLEAGDVDGLSEIVSGSSWIQALKEASDAVSASASARAAAGIMMRDVMALQASAGSEDGETVITRYISAAAALRDWALETGISSQLKGL